MPFVAGICIAVQAALVFLLGLNVSLNRQKAQKSLGVDPDPFHPLNVANRAHGNQAEYAGAIIGLMVYIAAYAPSYTADLMMIVFTAARLVFTFGMIGVDVKKKNNKFRYYGAIGTYLFGTLLSVYAGATAFLGY